MARTYEVLRSPTNNIGDGVIIVSGVAELPTMDHLDANPGTGTWRYWVRTDEDGAKSSWTGPTDPITIEDPGTGEPPPPAEDGAWVSLYVAGWNQDDKPLRTASFTHAVHFSAIPNSNGTLDTTTNGLSSARVSSIISQCHNAGKKVLLSVGGHPGSDNFPTVTAPANRAAFVQNIINFMDSPHGQGDGYDGIDIDWEFNGVNDTHLSQFTALISDLRAALNARGNGEVLQATLFGSYTAAAPAAAFAGADRVAFMSYVPYGLNAPHISPIHEPDPSPGWHGIERTVQEWAAAEVPLDRIMFGFSYYSWTYSGVTAPYQTPTGSDTEQNLSVHWANMTEARRRWDNHSKAAWFALTSPNRVVSAEDDRSIFEKAYYLISRGLGGAIIWNHGQGWVGTATPPDPLHASVANHFGPVINPGAEDTGAYAANTETPVSALYVSPTGNNSNNGSIDAPYRTIAYALTQVGLSGRPRTLYVRGGEYVEGLVNNPSHTNGTAWTAGNTNRVVGYPGDTVPVIRGVFRLNDFRFWEFRHLDFTWDDTQAASSHMVKMTNGNWRFTYCDIRQNKSFAGLNNTSWSNSNEPVGVVSYCRIWGAIPSNGTNQDHNVYITGPPNQSGNMIVERCLIYGAGNGDGIKTGFDNEVHGGITFRYNTVYNCSNLALAAGIYNGGMDYHHNLFVRGRHHTTPGSPRSVLQLWAYGGTQTGWFHDNAYHDVSATLISIGGGTNSSYQTSVNGGGNVQIDPQFVDAASGDLHTQNPAVAAYGRYAV